MRKMFLLGMLGLAALSYSQEKDSYVAVVAGIDVRNAVVGSNPTENKPAVNSLIQFLAVGQNVEMAVSYENFQKIQFNRLGLGFGYHFPLYAYIGNSDIKTTFIPSVEASAIYRKQNEDFHIDYKYDPGLDNYTAGFIALGVNATFSWDLTENLMLQATGQFMTRPDLDAAYGGNHKVWSNFLKLGYKF